MIAALLLFLQMAQSEGKITGFEKIRENYRIERINLITKRYGEIKRRMARLNQQYTYENYPPFLRVKKYALNRKSKQPSIIRILVLRVEFQKEQPDDPKSTGDGTFIMTSNGQPMIIGTDCEGNPVYNPYYDPPHDWTYFNALSEALSDYYAALTYGKVRIEWVVKPDSGLPPYKVPHRMGYYAAWGQDPELGLVTFLRDAFISADRDTSIHFEDLDNNGIKDYQEGVLDRYVIFHPGSAWQTDLNMDSPYDMPAVTVPAGALEYYLGVPYIVLNGGQDTVFDAEIMSETMSQDGIDVRINGTFFHESGHNLFFYPDLYDTKYNGSGVGAFGIMTTGPYLSAEGIPSGVLPPYPNAWTRLWTDWILKYMFGEGFIDSRILKILTPDERPDTTHLLPVDVGVDSFVVRRHGKLYYTVPYFAEDPYTGIRFLKVPVNSHEYFLFENLQTNLSFNDTVVCGDSAKVFGKWKNGVLVHFFGENDYLEPADGILVWHVDDRIYWEHYAYNEVNAVRPMAVDVVEADHVQDFEKWTDMSPYAYTWFGCPYDTYFKGNNTELAPWTTPSSDDNEGNKTNLVFYIPDTIKEDMRVIAKREKSISGFPLRIGYALIDSNINYKIYDVPQKSFMEFDSVFAVVQLIERDSLDLITLDTTEVDSYMLFSVLSKTGSVLFTDTIRNQMPVSEPVIFKENERVSIAFPTQEGIVHFYRYEGDSVENVWNLNIGNEIRGFISMGYFKDTLFVFIGAEDQKLHLIDINGVEQHTFSLSAPVRCGAGTYNMLLFTGATDGTVSIIDDRGNIQHIGTSYPSPYNSPLIATRFPDTSIGFLSVKGNGEVEALGIKGDRLWRRIFNGSVSPYVATGHYDEGTFFVFVVDNKIYAVNTSGALLDGFPVLLSDSSVNGIITADLDGDMQDEIIVAVGEHVFAYNVHGKETSSFPLQASKNVRSLMAVNLDSDNGLELAYITEDGYLFAEDFDINSATMPHIFNTPSHNIFVDIENTINEVVNSGISLLYVYPNPVKEGKAKLRFKVGFGGTGRIDFVNYSGRVVKTQNFNFNGKTIEEIDLDLSDVEPDLYYLHVKFNGEGQREEKIIKMFVISKGGRR